MKHRAPASILIPIILLLILIGFMMVIPKNFLREDGLVNIVPNTIKQLSNIFSYWIVWVVMGLALGMLLIVNAINKVIERKKFNKLSVEDQTQYLSEKKEGYVRRLIRSSREKQSDQEESEIILDHGFDGIKELDNALPQWWLALFYIGCIFCVIYVLAYFTTDFAHPYDEYEVETAQLENQFNTWIKANDIDVTEANMANANLDHGKEIFQNICATCHTANGGGATGPNLTDPFWINHLNDDLYKNIYTMAYDGSPNNPAMQAFGQTKQLTGLDIQDVAAYVYSLNQETPEVTVKEGGLPPQGNLVKTWLRKGETAAQAEAEAGGTSETPAATTEGATPATKDTVAPSTN